MPSNLSELRIVLVNSRNPLNIGAAARAMSNFGFSRLCVVNPYEPSFREARSAVGASDLLRSAEQYDTVAAAVTGCALVVGTTAARDRELQHRLKPLPEAASEIRTSLESGKVALLYGSEKRGLSNEDLSYCHWLLRIPTREEHPAMNLGQSVAVTLYEVAKEGVASNQLPEVQPVATSELLDRLETTLLEALSSSGYTDSAAEASTTNKARRLLRRLALTAEDAETLLGMLRQITWKLRPPADR